MKKWYTNLCVGTVIAAMMWNEYLGKNGRNGKTGHGGRGKQRGTPHNRNTGENAFTTANRVEQQGENPAKSQKGSNDVQTVQQPVPPLLLPNPRRGG